MNETLAEGNDPKSKESRARWGPQAGCPMASMCSGIFARGTSRFLLMLPGAALILISVAILVQPQVLVWLVAGVTGLLGLAMLLMAQFMYRFGTKARAAGRFRA